ncbi:MAG: DinB family protein [Dehalococcoidia bacterium]|nr:DinB family protein [Dehalococcoidia bacterium]
MLQHGELVDPEATFTVALVEHVTTGTWLGNGDPTPGFGPDFQPLKDGELGPYLQHLTWLRADILPFIHDLTPEQIVVIPDSGGWSIYRILEHVAESERVYLRMTVGKVDGLSATLRSIQPDPEVLSSALVNLWQIISSRLIAMTGVEREQKVPHGQVTWTARRGLRRMLEHNWEHLVQLSGLL